MAIVPRKTVDLLQFYQDRVPAGKPWALNTVAIGLAAGDVTSLNTKLVAAQDALNDQQSAKNAYRAATLALDEAVRALSLGGSEAIQKIKAKGMTDTNVFVLAQIPAPGTPTPLGPPGTAESLVATLKPDGSLAMKFKCKNPAGSQGTLYQISRRIGTSGPMVFLATAGKRSFVDSTVPAGTTQVTYRIVAERSTARGDAQEFTVKFGVGSSGEMTATVASGGQPPRLAA